MLKMDPETDRTFMHHMSTVRMDPVSTKQLGCCPGNRGGNRETVPMMWPRGLSPESVCI